MTVETLETKAEADRKSGTTVKFIMVKYNNISIHMMKSKVLVWLLQILKLHTQVPSNQFLRLLKIMCAVAEDEDQSLQAIKTAIKCE